MPLDRESDKACGQSLNLEEDHGKISFRMGIFENESQNIITTTGKDEVNTLSPKNEQRVKREDDYMTQV